VPVVAVAGLGVVVAALAALLLLYGARLLGQFIGQLVPNWHIPGLGNIRGAVMGAIDSALQAVESTIQAAIGPVENWLRAPFHALQHLIDATITALESAFSAVARVWHAAGELFKYATTYAHSLFHTLQVLLGDAIKYLGLYAHTLYTLAIRYSAALFRYATSYAHELVHGLQVLLGDAIRYLGQYAHTLYSLAVKYAAELFKFSTTYAHGLYEAALAEAGRLFDAAARDALAWARAAEQAAKAYASAAIAAASRVIATDITTPVEQAWVAIRDDVAAIEQILGADLPDVKAIVRRIDVARVGDIATAAGALAAVDVLVLRYLRDCGIPGCKSLSGLIRELPRLFELVEGAAFLAFLVDMCHDPAGTAGEVESVAGGIITDTVDVMSRVLGL
jgi:ABC-type multidrug transport system fused ATPase/permease subunit